jgi:hypothetical protein
MLKLFHALVVAHMVCGTIGLISLWVPMFALKGSPLHRKAGKLFGYSILTAGIIAICLSTLTLIDPLATHPHLKDETFVRAIFGTMMFYLAILTVNLAWHGMRTIALKRDHAKHRSPLSLALQFILIMAATVCAYEGYRVDQPLMLAASVIGFATAGTNLRFILKSSPAPKAYLAEHVKSIVGAGISVYTAFFAFGSLRFTTSLALNPVFWAIPLSIGLIIIIWQWYKLGVLPGLALLQRATSPQK